MKIRTWITYIAVAIATGLAAPCASATSITYDVINLGGSSWRYDYSVSNDSLAVPLEEFTLFFELGLYSNLHDSLAPAAWDAIIAQPDPLLPDDGFVDVLGFPGIAPGDTLGGFSVVFDWLGLGTPGSQPFDILTPDPFTVIDSGFTAPGSTDPTSVPEPGTLALMGIGLLACAGMRRKHRATAR